MEDFFPKVNPSISPPENNDIQIEIIPNIDLSQDTFEIKGLLWNCRSARSKLRQDAIRCNI
jgi:hypothetical protein